ncbi:E3 ubiquitin-protein ligase HUWE1 [Chionoecetes opilio]|uniref:E3 ubiquitin-protein ligase HUWE1 n=1 Tax=Chionoecetes opilio TaxID=41210 RepID=A0A8J4YNF1_CHIOP|nr:E3 ubiquitin-protein ligase HUWE1 [Chionoecetes opilio]
MHITALVEYNNGRDLCLLLPRVLACPLHPSSPHDGTPPPPCPTPSRPPWPWHSSPASATRPATRPGAGRRCSAARRSRSSPSSTGRPPNPNALQHCYKNGLPVLQSGSRAVRGIDLITSSLDMQAGLPVPRRHECLHQAPGDYSEAKTGLSCPPQRAPLIKSVLNFLKEAIQEPGFSECMRHFMAGSLPASLKPLFISNAEYYGASLFR